MSESGRKSPLAADAISDDHLRALGKLTIDFGTLEFVAAVCVWVLLEPDSLVTSQTITAQLSFSACMDLLESLALQKLSVEPLLTAIQDFSKRAREAEQERNRMVHAHWAVDPNGSLLRVKYTARGKKGFNEQQEPVTAEDIAAVYGRVADAASSCSPILGELLNRFPMMGGNLTVELGAV